MKLYRIRCTDCGWTSKVTMQGRAQYAYRKHSCERQEQRRESLQRGLARHAAVDRTPQPCLHKLADHQHGTHACYVLDRCRCFPCSVANSNYERARLRRRAYGRDNFVPAGPARRHVRKLTAAGIGLKRIAVLAGVPHGTLWRLMYGKPRRRGKPRPSKRIHLSTEQRILAVPVDPAGLAGGAKITSIGAARRLQALTYLGWSIGQLSAHSGMDRQRLDRTINGGTVLASTDRAIRALYEQLWDQQPPQANQRERIAATRSRRRALEAGWAPPMAWDEESIDDPAAVPMYLVTGEAGAGVDEAAIERRLAGDVTVELTRAERWTVVRRLHSQGLNDREIAARTGLWDRQVLRDRQALGLAANVPSGRTSIESVA